MATTGDVEHLDPDATGRWLIVTRSGTVHILDLDARTYQRRPGPTSQRFAHDNTIVALTRVQVWPHVGGRMLIWFDDPHDPDLLEHFRACSRIDRIVRDRRGIRPRPRRG